MAPVRVLVVDDSAVIRGLLTRALEQFSDLEVVASAMDGDRALRVLRSTPVNLVLLDVMMPVMDGITTLRQIRREFPEVRVIMASRLTAAGTQLYAEAMSLGAAACVGRPEALSAGDGVRQMVTELRPLLEVIRRRAWPGDGPSNRLPAIRPDTPVTTHEGQSPAPRLIVVGASTGGPRVLSELLTGLPPELGVPILITQHMPARFTEVLAQRLTNETGWTCREGADGSPVVPDEVRIAPGGRHMQLEQRDGLLVTAIHDGPPERFCRPSVNPLFRTAAEHVGRRTLAVVLTGMGADGVEGAAAIASRGGTILVQDEASSVVWGMPGAVVRAGLADAVLAPQQIVERIQQLCGTKAGPDEPR